MTSAGRRMPLNPTPLRASRTGTGRSLSLVVEGHVIGGLHEDPAGEVVGYESHFATCPNAPQHRTTKTERPVPTWFKPSTKVEPELTDEQAKASALDRAARFRCRRAALRPLKLQGLPEDVVARLAYIEEGAEEPACGWETLEGALTEMLERRLMEWAPQIKLSGLFNLTLCLPFTPRELRDAWATAQARLELAAEVTT